MQYLILISLVTFVYVYAEVDYWGIYKKESIEEKVYEKKINQEEPTAQELFELSKKWYLKRLKKEKSPVEYYYFLNPEKYADAYWKWITWIQEKGNNLIQPVIAKARDESVDFEKAVKVLKARGYSILYFYSPICPYCKASEPEVERIERYLKVYRIDVTKEKDMVSKWNVNTTPTFIAVSPLERKAYRIVGYQPYTQIIYQIYKRVKDE